ncbi:hypothetical protein BJ165DRAFT_1613645 [Panaeolus papilionaceus]|nr:hypothetical protein BJ165DRAFT_1613645 [Panaeolus papilionaceus]
MHHHEHLPISQQFGRDQVRRTLRDECLGIFKTMSTYLKTLQQRKEEPITTLQSWNNDPQVQNSTLSSLGSAVIQTVFGSTPSTATTATPVESTFPSSTFVGTLLNMPISFNNVANTTGSTFTSTEQHSVVPDRRRRR